MEHFLTLTLKFVRFCHACEPVVPQDIHHDQNEYLIVVLGKYALAVHEFFRHNARREVISEEEQHATVASDDHRLIGFLFLQLQQTRQT